MITSYVVTDTTVPVSPESLVAALQARAVWQEVLLTHEPGLLWDQLYLAAPPFEVRVQFTVGDALPSQVREWLPWGGRGLGEEQRRVIAAPGATYRIEGPVLGGGIPLTGPQGPRTSEADRADKDLARRSACFTAAVAAEIAMAVEGVLLDLLSQRFWGGDAERFTAAAFDVRDFVSVHAEHGEDGLDLHTHGMARFGRPDVEMGHVPREVLTFGTHVLNEVAQHQALGNVVKNSETVLIDGDYPFAVSMSARSREHVGNDVIALVDPVDAPVRDARAPRFTLARFCEDVADDLAREADLDGALAWLTRSIALSPDRGQAWRKRAGVNLHLGRAEAADEDMAQAEWLENGRA